MDTSKPQGSLTMKVRWYHGMTVFGKYTDGTLCLDDRGLRLVDSANKELFAFTPGQVKYVAAFFDRMSIKSKAGRRYALVFKISTVFSPSSPMSVLQEKRVFRPSKWAIALKARGYPPYNYTWVVVVAVLVAIAVTVRAVL